MTMLFAMLGAWAMMIGAHYLSPAEGLPVMLVFFGTPLLTAFLMCRGNRKNDITIGGTLSGALLWGILNALAGGLMMRFAPDILPAIPASADVPQESPAQMLSFTLLFFTLLLAILPPLTALVWRLILNAKGRTAE